MELEYTMEEYKTCLQEARKIINKIDELQLATMNLNNGFGWKDFGTSVEELFELRKQYGKVLSDCALAAYDRCEGDKS